MTRAAEMVQGQTAGQDGSTKDEAVTFTEAGGLVAEASHSAAQGTCLCADDKGSFESVNLCIMWNGNLLICLIFSLCFTIIFSFIC